MLLFVPSSLGLLTAKPFPVIERGHLHQPWINVQRRMCRDLEPWSLLVEHHDLNLSESLLHLKMRPDLAGLHKAQDALQLA
jgi:hypothetical protein